jgi:RTX calcium-binding nonapeptide repeat (4 copies)
MAIVYGKFGAGRSENITGTASNDEIYPLGGNDVVDGGRGVDTVFVESLSTAFKITTVNGITYLDATSGASTGQGVTLRNTEYVRFNDKTVSLLVSEVFNNTLQADFYDGGPGTDTVRYAEDQSAYSIATNPSSSTLTIRRIDFSEGTDFLTNIERVVFKDSAVAFDVGPNETTGEVLLLLSAIAGKQLIVPNAPLVGAAIGIFEQGFSMSFMAGFLMQMPIWAGGFTATNSSADIARHLISTTFARPASEAEVAAGAAAIDAERASGNHGAFLFGLANAAEHHLRTDLPAIELTGVGYIAGPSLG